MYAIRSYYATVANGKLEVLQRKGEEMPVGWAQDKDGNPTTDPTILKQGGSMLPLGGDRQHGGHKGYCLGAWVDIFSAVLSGANYGPWVPPFVAFLDPPANPVGEGIGHFVGVITSYSIHYTKLYESFHPNAAKYGRNKTYKAA